MRNWSLKKKIGMGALALFVVLCIVAAIVVPIEFCIRLGEESEWMWSPEQEFSVEYAAGTLRKDPDKDFVIVNFTDTQAYLPSDFDSVGKIYKTMKKVIDETNPDLITLTGDQASKLCEAGQGAGSLRHSVDFRLRQSRPRRQLRSQLSDRSGSKIQVLPD